MNASSNELQTGNSSTADSRQSIWEGGGHSRTVVIATERTRLYMKVQKSKPLPSNINKSYYNLLIWLDFLIKLECKISSRILYVGIKYSLRDLICDVVSYSV